MKSIRLVLTVFFLISFCSNSSTPISVSSLNDIIGSTTNKIEVSNSNWQEYIGKSNDGNFVALRVDSEIDPDGVLIVFSKEDLKNGIEEGGRVMNPLDRNVVDKMAVLGIIPLPVDILSLQKNIEPSKFSIEFNVQGDFQLRCNKNRLYRILHKIHFRIASLIFC